MSPEPEQHPRALRLAGPPAFEVSTRQNGDVREIRLSGELDLAGMRKVEQALERAERSDAARIVVDLGGVTFMDSTGVRLMLGAQARSRNDSERLVLRRGRPSVQRVFEICAVEGLLPFTD